MEGCVATVYVIEPDAAIRDAMQTLLSAFEVPVLTYAVPEEFMSTLSSDISGCVLCEALLPTGSGLQVARDLREMGHEIPLILLVEKRNAQIIDAARDAGVQIVLEKPLIYDELMLALEEIGESAWPGLSAARGVEATLSCGTAVHIRPMMPNGSAGEDAPVVYFSAPAWPQNLKGSLKQPHNRLLNNFSDIHYPNNFALVAMVESATGVEEVGLARYVATPNQRAEFAIAVTDAWQRQGVASVLLRHLLQCAEKAGIRNLSGLIRRDNQAMLALARKCLFTLRADKDKPDIVVATKKLGK